VVDLRAVRLLVFAITVAIGCLAPSRGGAAIEGAVTWFIFVDDLHIDFRDTGYLRNLLTSIATELNGYHLDPANVWVARLASTAVRSHVSVLALNPLGLRGSPAPTSAVRRDYGHSIAPRC
jgi:hypothetical protein